MAFKGTPKTLDKTLPSPLQYWILWREREREIKIFSIEEEEEKEEFKCQEGEKLNNRFSLKYVHSMSM
jgi:hypothetical protein